MQTPDAIIKSKCARAKNDMAHMKVKNLAKGKKSRNLKHTYSKPKEYGSQSSLENAVNSSTDHLYKEFEKMNELDYVPNIVENHDNQLKNVSDLSGYNMSAVLTEEKIQNTIPTANVEIKDDIFKVPAPIVPAPIVPAVNAKEEDFFDIIKNDILTRALLKTHLTENNTKKSLKTDEISLSIDNLSIIKKNSKWSNGHPLEYNILMEDGKQICSDQNDAKNVEVKEYVVKAKRVDVFKHEFTNLPKYVPPENCKEPTCAKQKLKVLVKRKKISLKNFEAKFEGSDTCLPDNTSNDETGYKIGKCVIDINLLEISQ